MADYIDRQAIRDAMYHEAFETDSDMQRWDGGCWIRYKMFENVIDRLPSVEVLTEEDYTELRDRFGEFVEFIVRDMISKEGKRWETTLTGTKDVQPVRRGHWEKIGDKTWWGLYECSECHLICSIDYDYCPHCGAKMKMNP